MRHPKKHSLHHPSNPHRPVNLRLERWHRRSMYGVCLWLLASGLLWLLAHYLMRPAGEFGETIHPLEPWSMKLHGAGAMAALFFVGSIVNSHIRRAIKSGRNVYSGWAMIGVLALLASTGYVLYYFAGEQSRPAWSAIHWITGLLFSSLTVVHIVLGRRSSVSGR